MADEKYPKTTIEVTCPVCHETYNLRTDKHKFMRNCRCSRGTFEIEQGTGLNQVRVYFTGSFTPRTEFKNFTIIAQEK